MKTITVQNKFKAISVVNVLALILTISQTLPANNEKYLPGTDVVAAHEHQQELIGGQRSPSALGYSLTSANTADKMSRLVQEITRRSLPLKYKMQAAPIARAIILEAAKNEMDPLFLVAVIKNESSFNPTMIGGVGEVGLMQIRPSTSRDVMKKIGMKKANLKDPITNIRIGAAYMKMLRDKFVGDSRLYISAYNMGSTKVRSLVKQERKPREYVMRVMKYYVDFIQTLNGVLS